MKAPKTPTRRWIPGKRGARGHFSHCRDGHPWTGPGPCTACRVARDAERHAQEDVKAADAKRKQNGRWARARDLKTVELEGGITLDFWRGSARIRCATGSVIVPPLQVVLLMRALLAYLESKPPSKWPKNSLTAEPVGQEHR